MDVQGNVLLQSPDGATAELSFGFDHYYRCDYSLWGSRGRIILERAYTPPATRQPLLRLEQQDRVQELRLPPQDQIATVLGEFAAAVLDDAEPRETPADILRQATLLDQIRACAEVDR